MSNNRLLSPILQCELRTDALTRQLYATDASIYQIVPMGVAFPRTAAEAGALMVAAAGEGIPLTPRGAGTGLAGGALGEGLVIDAARHNTSISALNRDAKTVRVGAGVVLDQLNGFLAPHGLCFGPDVATSSRATLGGMIANNSSGARAPRYGATIDHVRSIESVTVDGATVQFSPEQDHHRDKVDALLRGFEAEVETRLHRGIVKRWPGYALDRYLRAQHDLTKLWGGSEGTLGLIFSAELQLVPLPSEKGLGLIFFDTVEEAMQATVELMDLNPVAIEHIDDVLFDQTRGQRQFRAARDLLQLDTHPCRAILMVEFHEDIQERLAALELKRLGLRKYLCKDATEQGHVWNLRKSGLTLLTSRKGDAKPTAGIEDVAVPPAKLPDYVAGLRSLMKPLGLEASFYGHAASGLLHVRPVVDMHQAEDIRKFRQLADGVSALTKQFKGALAAEHGVGIARTEYMPAHLGPLLEVMRGIKRLLDPKNLMNPGKIFPDGRYQIDSHLRQGEGRAISLPFDPLVAFSVRDEAFVPHLEQCNGNGACRKHTNTMCPTYLATGEEIMVTRGRANTIRAVLDGRLGDAADPLASRELHEALNYCLSCKACKNECPSNVDMALLKAELLHARQKKSGVPLSARMISRVDLLGKLGSMMPGLANGLLGARWFRKLLEIAVDFDARRPLPPYAPERFDHWFRNQPRKTGAKRGKVILWDDCFVRHNEPNIGRAAVNVLEALGYEVTLPAGRACCGRPAFSAGRLDLARDFGARNSRLLGGGDIPIVFLEPSCFAMFSDDYTELRVPGAAKLAHRAVLFEEFVDKALAAQPLDFQQEERSTAIHVHCHAKALADPAAPARLARRIPGNTVQVLDTGCCGMAGAFGSMRDKYDLSLKVAAPLLSQVSTLEPGTVLVASGTSCRHQLEHLADVHPLHIAELLSGALPEKGAPA